MHTREILTSADFAFTVGGHKASLEDVFPRFNEHDRIGVVVPTPQSWNPCPTRRPPA